MSAPERSLAYRPELDGIRAFAVLAVVLYHLEVPPFTGGYIGVDIFFVLSGHLISGIIRSQQEAGRFSLREFYVRRVRRLLPAALTVIAVTLGLAVWLFSPEMLVGHARLSLASALSLANLELFFQSGYFDVDASSKPLLHMWSLGVEEQFYLVWPALLVLCLRAFGPRRTLAVLAVGSLLSAAACVVLTWRLPALAFYFTPTRLFAFGLGAMLLWAPPAWEQRWGRVAGVGGLLGLGALCAVPLAQASYPGLGAVAVAALAAALIFGSRAQPLRGLLAHPLMAAVGRVSYSLYLVHWPLLVFYRFVVQRDLGLGDQIVLIALAFALAVALYRGVERPFRVGGRWPRPPARLWPLAALLVLVLGAGTQLVRAGGLPGRVQPAAGPTSRDLEAAERAFCRAPLPTGNRLVTCVTSRGPAGTVYVWGDSHALHLAPGLAAVLPRSTVDILYLSSCNPLLGLSALPYSRLSGGRQACVARNTAALAFFQAAPPATVLISARWSVYLTTPATRREAALALRRLTRTLEARGHRVVVVGNVIEPGLGAINCLRAPETWLTPHGRCQPSARIQGQVRAVNAALLAAGPNVYDPAPLFCAPRCRLDLYGVPLFRDGHHVNAAGSRLLVSAVARRAGLLQSGD